MVLNLLETTFSLFLSTKNSIQLLIRSEATIVIFTCGFIHMVSNGLNSSILLVFLDNMSIID
jgi:hypothetical protein